MAKIFCFLISLFTFAYGFIIFTGAGNAIQQIAALELFMIAAVLFGAAAIIEAIDKLRKANEKK